MTQMKEQIKPPEELNKIGMSNLPDAQFKTLVIIMLKDLVPQQYKKRPRQK